MDGLIFIYILFGLAIGSFVSAVTYRIPRELGFVKGRSFCDNCKKQLYWYDNIPLLSYVFYLGESRCCQKRISIRYPLIEIATAIGFLILYLYSFSFVYYLLFTSLLIILIVDLEHQIIPDELSWLVLFLSLFIIHYSLFTSLFAGFLFSFLLLILYLVTSGRGMGLGDVKLAIPLAIILGLEKSLSWFLASFIIGGIVSIILLLLKKANLKSKIAFGPFMIVAFWIILFYEIIY